MTGVIDANTKDNERGLLPYPIILAANKGEREAMEVVILHYGSYMTSLSMRKLYDEQGNTYGELMKIHLIVYVRSSYKPF